MKPQSSAAIRSPGYPTLAEHRVLRHQVFAIGAGLAATVLASSLLPAAAAPETPVPSAVADQPPRLPGVPPMPLPARPAAPASQYVVKAGDTLWDIARRHAVTVDEIKTANQLTNNNIQLGQVLVIPAIPGVAGGESTPPVGDAQQALGKIRQPAPPPAVPGAIRAPKL